MAERYLVIPLHSMSLELEGEEAAHWLADAKTGAKFHPEEFRATNGGDGRTWHLALDKERPMRIEIEGEPGSNGVVRTLLEFADLDAFDGAAREFTVDESTEALRVAIQNYYRHVLLPAYNNSGRSPSVTLRNNLLAMGAAAEIEVLAGSDEEEGGDDDED